MADKKVVAWFTMNGKHIPIYEGESKDDAVKRSVTQGSKQGVTTHEHPSKEKKYGIRQFTPNKIGVYYGDEKIGEVDSKDKAEQLMSQHKAKADTSNKIEKKKSVAEQNEDIKDKQLAQAQAERDKLNGKKSNTLFKFDWDKLPGSATAHGEMVKYLKKHNIDWFNTPYFDLVANVDGDGNYYKLDHKGNGVVGIDRSKAYKKKG